MSQLLEAASGHLVPLVAFAILIVTLGVYQLSLASSNHGLAHIPGPFYSAYTNLVFKWYNLTGRRWEYVHGAHARYGPVVRLSPSEVSVATTEAVREIYKMGSQYRKTEFYNNFKGRPDEPSNLFNEVDQKHHALQRRRNAWQFSEQSVKLMEYHMRRNVNLTVRRMAEDIQAHSVTDACKWFAFMATDIIGESSFGESFNMLESGVKNQYSHDLELIGRNGLYRSELPWLFPIMRYFGLNKRFVELNKRMNSYAKTSIDRYWKAYNEDPDTVKPTLLTKTFGMVEDGTLAPEQLLIDARGNIIAGTDTTANAATSMLYLLALHPNFQSRLVAEIQSSLPTDFTDEDCRKLPFLNHVIHETLRMRPPVGHCLPRYVPYGGTTLSGHYVPEGTVIGIPTYTMHRDPSIFPEPDMFNPDRWNEPTAEMKAAFVAFGGGSRSCIGKHFAQLELRLAFCELFRTFPSGVRIAPGFDAVSNMHPFHSFLSSTRGNKLLVTGTVKS